MKLFRLVSLLGLAGVAAWIARLMAHSKVPPPEGRWREVTAEELGRRS